MLLLNEGLKLFGQESIDLAVDILSHIIVGSRYDHRWRSR